MTLGEAVEVLDGTDFGGANLEPEVLQAIGVVLNSAKTRVRGMELNDTTQRVVETSSD